MESRCDGHMTQTRKEIPDMTLESERGNLVTAVIKNLFLLGSRRSARASLACFTSVVLNTVDDRCGLRKTTEKGTTHRINESKLKAV